MCIGLGLTIVFGTMKIINMFHGQAVILGCYIAYWMYTLCNIDPYVFLLGAVPIFFLLGAGIYLFLLKPLSRSEAFGDRALLVTFGVMLLTENLMTQFWLPDTRSINTAYTQMSIPIGDIIVVPVTRLVALIIAVGVGLFLYLFLTKTYTGKGLRAASQNLVAATLMGVNVDRIYALSFAIATALGGISGVLISVVTPFYPGFGLPLLIKAFCIILIGGMGNNVGAIIGSFGLGITESFTGFLFSMKVKDGITYFIIIIAVLARSILKREYS